MVNLVYAYKEVKISFSDTDSSHGQTTISVLVTELLWFAHSNFI